MTQTKDELEISNKFKPLFRLLNKDYNSDVDTVIMTGGRYSLKSSTVSIFSLLAMVQYKWNVLYTRYTNMSITDSVKPEVSDKIEALGYQEIITDTQNHIECNGNRIAFKGIKTGSSVQTANLKSLSGFNCFIVDEAEEIPDFETFKKVFYSIRSETKRNLTILILNPALKEHWIFQEFFEKKGLEGGENTIIDNVMYIHTSYLDADHNRMPKNILADYRRLKVESPTQYENIVLGGWIREPSGVLIPRSKMKFEKMWDIEPIYSFAVGDPADTGGDKFSMPFIHVLEIDGRIVFHVKDVIHSTTGIEANTERVLDKLHQWKCSDLFYESNGVGLAAVLLIKNRLRAGQKIHAFNSTINKEVRIFSHFEFVQKFFVFDADFERNPEYKAFISDVANYQKDGDNKHRKDAIDVLCSSANILKIKFKNLLY